MGNILLEQFSALQFILILTMIINHQVQNKCIEVILQTKILPYKLKNIKFILPKSENVLTAILAVFSFVECVSSTAP